MTKAKMIELLQEKEAELWLDMARYDYDNAPRTGSYDDEIWFDRNDAGHCEKLHAWYSVYELLEAMNIEQNHGEEAFDLHHKLFIERQNARGIFYDEYGNQIHEEPETEPAEEDEEDEEDEEETEETEDKWLDTETGEVVTLADLWKDYEHNYTDEERTEYTFGQFLNNCQTYNGGTLERV